ncbi:MAG: hypothetical protein AB8V23_04345 [Candidatus Midichloria sp.]|uniref:Uncharacterized protein n=1 Tax=Hyalomma marginatum TaxID=34627 RepID=A0A8S4C2N6_9ACAR|nr:hypothetical protein MHYMCMPASI_00790 [Hyalomma marginatum]CAG7594954.1 hypothetical protein MHYMCMPSP_00920 [Hyalomma marginatum]
MVNNKIASDILSTHISIEEAKPGKELLKAVVGLAVGIQQFAGSITEKCGIEGCA